MGESYFKEMAVGVNYGAGGYDVVFLHGITGHFEHTWFDKGGCFWPHWLAEDIPTLKIIAAGYDSSFTADLISGAGASIRDRASILLDTLASRDTPQRPIIFVTHSLGGLIVKQILRMAQSATNLKKKAILKQVKGVAFLATPHQGADVAKVLNQLVGIATSQSMKELVKGSEQLLELAQWFSSWAVETSLPVAAFYETEKTKGVMVVDKMSANPGVHGCDPTAVAADHISITKLDSRDHHVYKSLCSFIKEVVAPSSCGSQAPAELDGDLADDYNVFTSQASSDRQSLSEKLESANRGEEIDRAERKKERFNMALQRNIALPSAVKKYTRIMSNVETRFNRHVVPAIHAAKTNSEIDALVQSAVLDPTLQIHEIAGEEISASLVESALYYLAGNCHLRWDDV